jgi:hypothetical protein
MSEESIVLPDSDTAARRAWVLGWVSRHGHFYGDNEQGARLDGCTHTICESCKEPYPKGGWTICSSCREKRDQEHHKQRERRPYESGMVYSDARDEFFEDLDSAIELADDEDIKVEDLRLVLCEPNYVRPLESDYCEYELAQDNKLPEAIVEAMNAFNAAVKGVIISWSPTEYAVKW